jgi:hypothetical protein
VILRHVMALDSTPRDGTGAHRGTLTEDAQLRVLLSSVLEQLQKLNAQVAEMQQSA